MYHSPDRVIFRAYRIVGTDVLHPVIADTDSTLYRVHHRSADVQGEIGLAVLIIPSSNVPVISFCSLRFLFVVHVWKNGK